jgi:hypothetical protein
MLSVIRIVWLRMWTITNRELERTWEEVVVGTKRYMCGKTEKKREHLIRTSHHQNGASVYSVNIRLRRAVTVLLTPHVSSPLLPAQLPLVCQGCLIIEASLSHSDVPHTAGLLWTSDQSDEENST